MMGRSLCLTALAFVSVDGLVATGHVGMRVGAPQLPPCRAFCAPHRARVLPGLRMEDDVAMEDKPAVTKAAPAAARSC